MTQVAPRRAPGRGRSRLGAKLLLSFGVTVVMFGLAEALARALFDLPLAHMTDRQGKYTPFLVDDEELGKFGHRDFEGFLVAAEFRNEVATNAQGFRAPEDYGPKQPGTFRILALGDSFTFGLGVEFDETFSEVLERGLRARFGERVESLNLGVIGHGTLQELKILERHRDLDPDLVILGFYARDVFDSAGGNDLVDNYNFARRDRPSAGDGSPRAPTSALQELRATLTRRLKLYRLFEVSVGGLLRTWYQPKDDPQRRQEAWEITGEALRRMDALLGKLGAQGLLLWIPYPRAIAAQDATVVEKLGSLALENLQIVSLLEPMKDAPAQYYYQLDSHWNPRGHAVAADALLQAVVAADLLTR